MLYKESLVIKLYEPSHCCGKLLFKFITLFLEADYIETDPYPESSQSWKAKVRLGLCGYDTNLDGADDMDASFSASENHLLQLLETSLPARAVKGLMTGTIVSICDMGSAISVSSSHGVSCWGSSHSPARGGGFPVDEGETCLRSL